MKMFIGSEVHAILMCTHASIANPHLLGQLRICRIVQLVTHLGIIAYSHSFQSTQYLNVRGAFAGKFLAWFIISVTDLQTLS